MVHSKRVFCLDKEHKFILTSEDLMNGLEMVKKFRIKEKPSYIPLMYT